jgi:hypothetical protein|nr:DUF2892 domain-containing protein [Moraxella osloensis]
MKVNEGKLDRTVRIVLGLVIIGLGFYYQSWWGAVGLLPLLTGLSGFCALYTLLGINTCPRKL